MIKKKQILILDNLDSFTYNLVHLFASVFHGEIIVKRAMQLSINEINKVAAIVLSPGPQRPINFPMNNQLLKRFYKEKPFLGVCLGMQAINEFFYGKTIYAPYPVHGKTSKIIHNQEDIFKNIPQNIEVARYHSLACEVNEKYAEITAYSIDSNVVMGIKIKQYPIFGVQYHPESFLTEYGKEIIKNFLSYV